MILSSSASYALISSSSRLVPKLPLERRRRGGDRDIEEDVDEGRTSWTDKRRRQSEDSPAMPARPGFMWRHVAAASRVGPAEVAGRPRRETNLRILENANANAQDRRRPLAHRSSWRTPPSRMSRRYSRLGRSCCLLACDTYIPQVEPGECLLARTDVLCK